MSLNAEQVKTIAKAAAEAVLKGTAEEEPSEDDIAKSLIVTENAFLSVAPDVMRKAYNDLDEDEQVEVLGEFADDPEGFIEETEERMRKAHEGDPDDYDDDDDDDEVELTEEDLAAMSPEDREAVLDYMEAAAESPMTAGEVEDAVDAGNERVAKAIAPELRKAYEQIEELQTREAAREAEDAAREMLPNLPLEDSEKTALIMSMSEMPAAQRKSMAKMLTQLNAAGGEYMDEVGTSTRGTAGGDIAKSADSMMAKARELKAANPGMRLDQAYAQVMSTPDGGELYKAARDEARA